MKLGTKVRVVGLGKTIYLVVEKDSPIRQGEWIVATKDGAMRSVKPESLKVV